MKKFFLIAMTVLMSCNFNDNKNAVSTKEVYSTAKTKIVRDNIKTTILPPDSDKTRIIGKWYRDEDRTAYWEFKDNGKVFFYEDGVLYTKSTYSISHNCGENSDNEFEFLKIVDEDGSEFCSEINGVNENNSGILSLTSMQNLKVALFVNNVNIKIAD